MKILITGGKGLVGTALAQKLKEQNHKVIFLSRHPGSNALGIPEFYWDVDKQEIAGEALAGVEAIVHLAGASINKRWSSAYKEEIISSRTLSTRLLLQETEKVKPTLKRFISASAVGYYPNDLKRTFTEKDQPGQDFLSKVCIAWEREAHTFEELPVSTAIVRIGVVLSMQGGALPQIVQPIKMGAGAPLGSGKQYMSWIHLNDLAGIFLHLIHNPELTGTYNAVAPQSVTNQYFTKQAAEVLGKWTLPINVPAAALKLALGEMAATALSSQKVSAQKITDTGYTFQFPELEPALRNLLD